MTRPVPVPLLGWLARLARQLALTLLAAVLTTLTAATLLTGAWLILDSAGALADAPYAWLGLFMVTLAFGSPGAVLFGLLVAPVAARAGRMHPGWLWLVSAAGGGALVLLTTNIRFALLGVLGGLFYAALEHQLTGWAEQRTGRRGTPG
ncbi:hypothetical protein DAERI_070053 [Deinococcus aerius]|uniref:Uncharacterized protein n=1 Tax=Deinococcus aerius TaxID=200253 RepID=A0A2I9DYR2_9DEIO|nr:hypothetical protein [Deinococcus aerius]GBF06055.1 hypothetical protein DAERI_070053 [Deinococcus aerius]